MHFGAFLGYWGILKGIVGRFILAAAQHTKMKKSMFAHYKTKMSKSRLNYNAKENQKNRIKTIERSKLKNSSLLENPV